MEASPLSLEAAIKQIFAPVLRADGFRGAGRTFRKVVDGIICVVNFQGSQYGGQFAINLGLHPVVIADMNGAAPDPKKIKDYACEFRCRLAVSNVDQWWEYNDQATLNAAVNDALAVYRTVGRKIFETQTGPDAPLYTMTPEQFIAGTQALTPIMMTDVRAARALALLRQSSGAQDEARAFAAIALSRLGGATALKAELETIING